MGAEGFGLVTAGRVKIPDRILNTGRRIGHCGNGLIGFISGQIVVEGPKSHGSHGQELTRLEHALLDPLIADKGAVERPAVADIQQVIFFENLAVRAADERVRQANIAFLGSAQRHGQSIEVNLCRTVGSADYQEFGFDHDRYSVPMKRKTLTRRKRDTGGTRGLCRKFGGLQVPHNLQFSWAGRQGWPSHHLCTQQPANKLGDSVKLGRVKDLHEASQVGHPFPCPCKERREKYNSEALLALHCVKLRV